jgi:hypothetical protein
MSSREDERVVEEFRAYGQRGATEFLGVQGGRSSEGLIFPEMK